MLITSTQLKQFIELNLVVGFTATRCVDGFTLDVTISKKDIKTVDLFDKNGYVFYQVCAAQAKIPRVFKTLDAVYALVDAANSPISSPFAITVASSKAWTSALPDTAHPRFFQGGGRRDGAGGSGAPRGPGFPR